MPDGTGRQRFLADVLWEAMWVSRDAPESGSMVQRAYRSRIYEPIVQRSSRRIAEHRNPEPYLSLRSVLELLAERTWSRSQNRYQGLVGGASTEFEYRQLATGKVALPLLLIAGYPRSGTTSMQTVVRWAFPRNICEVETMEDRFSLWEYPKHNSNAMARVLEAEDVSAWVLVSFRSFIDCAASLVVGRGSRTHVDVAYEAKLWESWIPLLSKSRAIPVSFDQIARLTPHQMAHAIAQRTGVEIQRELEVDSTHENLMVHLNKGVVDNPWQSNVPQESRKSLLEEARQWVVDQLGDSEVARLNEIYRRENHQIEPLGTVDPP